MWTIEEQQPPGERCRRFVLCHDSAQASYGDVLRAWRDDGAFGEWFSERLADTPWTGLRWETPPITADTLDRPFEFVTLRSDALERTADWNAFADYFDPTALSVTFANLRGDAVLVVPCPTDDRQGYSHLLAFLRRSDSPQQHVLWRCVAEAVFEWLEQTPQRKLWLSTAGMGVAWLHIRLDSRPKYYGYDPYCR